MFGHVVDVGGQKEGVAELLLYVILYRIIYTLYKFKYYYYIYYILLHYSTMSFQWPVHPAGFLY